MKSLRGEGEADFVLVLCELPYALVCVSLAAYAGALSIDHL